MYSQVQSCMANGCYASAGLMQKGKHMYIQDVCRSLKSVDANIIFMPCLNAQTPKSISHLS